MVKRRIFNQRKRCYHRTGASRQCGDESAVAGMEDSRAEGSTVRRQNSFVGGTAERKTHRGVDVGGNGS